MMKVKRMMGVTVAVCMVSAMSVPALAATKQEVITATKANVAMEASTGVAEGLISDDDIIITIADGSNDQTQLTPAEIEKLMKGEGIKITLADGKSELIKVIPSEGQDGNQVISFTVMDVKK